MNLPLELADRVRELFISGKWIANTNYKNELEHISWEVATYKIDTLNSILDLTYHINYYLKGILTAHKTGKLEIRDSFSFDSHNIVNQDDWNSLVEELLQNAEKLAGIIESLEIQQLAQPFFDPKYGNYLRNIEGLMEHSYYHLGQLVLIKKLVLGRVVF